MKKTISLLALTALFLTSCSLSKSVREKRNLINGTWTLNTISFENNEGEFKALLFNDAEDICFEGSTWFFRDNNSTGKYTIAPSTLCNGGDRYIRWSVVERSENYESQLQFKFIDSDYKDISGGIGYRLNIETLTAQTMTLKSNITLDGESDSVTVVYNFTKN